MASDEGSNEAQDGCPHLLAGSLACDARGVAKDWQGTKPMIESKNGCTSAQAARLQAEMLIKELREAQATSEKQLALSGKADAFKRVTGKSSIERAIECASGIAAVLRRAEQQTTVLSEMH